MLYFNLFTQPGMQDTVFQPVYSTLQSKCKLEIYQHQSVIIP